MTAENIPKTSEEIIYYRGQKSGLEPIIKTINATIILAAAVYILSLRALDPMMEDIGGYLWFSIILIWSSNVAWAWWGWGNTQYVLSSRKITFERGRFGKTIKSIELWRVRELIFHRNFLESLFGMGKITLVSKDLTGPFTLVGPINSAVKVYESLNEAREIAVRDRGVMAVEG